MSWTNANGDPIPGPTNGNDVFVGDTNARPGPPGAPWLGSINGLGGNDTLVGGTGTDGFSGGPGDDSIVDAGGAANQLLGDGGNDTLSAAGSFGIYFLNGGADNDLLIGGLDAGQLRGGAGNDTLVGGPSGDLLDGGADLDTADYASETAALTIALDATDIGFGFREGSAIGAGIGTDRLFTIENIIGGSDDDSIVDVGGLAANRFEGRAGNDTLDGGGGNDTLLGGLGDDLIDTGDDDDLAIWRIGDGNDTIAMGEGRDTLALEGWTGDHTDFWSIQPGAAGTTELNYVYDDGAGNVFTLRTSGVETVTCFAPGTRILTARGEVPVETLRAGDLVVAPGRGAPLKPVRWVGHLRVDIARHRHKRKVAPILVRAGALGAGAPARDLRVSPEHAFLLQGRLVPAQLLVNGSTIIQETWHRALTYWHVELDEHGVLVAEGALAESYFDDGNRHLFDNGVIALHADLAAPREAGRYAAAAFAPLVTSVLDPALARIRAALPAAQAQRAARPA